MRREVANALGYYVCRRNQKNDGANADENNSRNPNWESKKRQDVDIRLPMCCSERSKRNKTCDSCRNGKNYK